MAEYIERGRTITLLA